MVRIMALFDLKDYLTLEDLSEYLNKIGFSYEIVNENEYYRLVNDVSDLLEQHKMTAVFPFTGMTINKSLYLTKVRGGGNGYDIEDIQDDCFIDGYFYLDFNHFLELKNRELKTYNKNFRLYSIKSQFNPYEEYLQSVSTDDEKRMEFFIPKVKNNIVKFSDIRFPRLELDKLFIQLPQADNSELVQQLQAENERLRAELQKQLKQQAGKDTQSDTPADGEPTDKGQGDSLLILGAVMETMPKLKPNYTQQSHIAEILETYKSVSGISQSTLEKKFSQAKRYLKQCIN